MLVYETDRSLKRSPEPRRTLTSGPLNELTAGFFRTLGHPARIRILEVLADGEKSVRELLPRIGVEASTLSQHLGALRCPGIVARRRDAHAVIYALASPDLAVMVGLARTVLAGTLAYRADLLDDLRRDANSAIDSAAARLTLQSQHAVEHVAPGDDR